MTREEIIKILEQSDRWEVNDQPPIEAMADWLVRAGAISVTVDAPDSISFILSQPLTAELAYTLGRDICPDSPDEIDPEATAFSLWWD